MDIIFNIIIFLFGTIIGSFLNVVAFRYRTGRSLGGRSACMTCARGLRWFELVPVASFVVQGGKCMRCRSKISPQYPLVETATGLFFVLIAWKYAPLAALSLIHFSVFFTYAAWMLSVLMVISIYDIRHQIIPDGLVWGFNFVAFVSLIFISGNGIVIHTPTLMQLVAGPLLAAPFFLLWIISHGKWMGLGDIKLMLGIGWFLGLSAGVLALTFSFWIGALAGIVLLVAGGKNYGMKTAIPFGPFLVLGTVIVFLLGVDITSFFGGLM